MRLHYSDVQKGCAPAGVGQPLALFLPAAEQELQLDA